MWKCSLVSSFLFRTHTHTHTHTHTKADIIFTKASKKAMLHLSFFYWYSIEETNAIILSLVFAPGFPMGLPSNGIPFHKWLNIFLPLFLCSFFSFLFFSSGFVVSPNRCERTIGYAAPASSSVDVICNISPGAPMESGSADPRFPGWLKRLISSSQFSLSLSLSLYTFIYILIMLNVWTCDLKHNTMGSSDHHLMILFE